jgi:ATP-dependent Clp protease ATP-binding subunit ClpC
VFERFTDRARRVLVLAQEEARLLGHDFIGTEHILLGLTHEGDSLAAQALELLGISLESVRTKVEETAGPASGRTVHSPPFTPGAKKVCELSFREALQLGHDYIGPEHILLGLIREGKGVAAQVLLGLGVDLQQVRATVVSMCGVKTGMETTTRPGVSAELSSPSNRLLIDFDRTRIPTVRTRASLRTGLSFASSAFFCMRMLSR